MNCIFRRFLILSALLLLSTYTATGRTDDWRSVTNKSVIEDMAIDGDFLICATNGGVLVFDRINESIVATFTNTEGLSDNHPLRVVVDNNHNWWFGMSNGDLNVFNQQTREWRIFSDFSRLTIHDMVLNGDSLFVALDIGISVFLLNKNEAKETYKNLGNIPVEVDVFSSLIDRHIIWVGTDFGLAFADLNQVNLKAPQSWENISTDQGLLSNKVRAIQNFQDSFFIGSDIGVQRYQNEQWTNYPSLPVYQTVQFFSQNSDLYVAMYKYIYLFDPNSDSWVRKVTLSAIISSFYVDSNNVIWIGTEDAGFFKFDPSEQELKEIVIDGPRGNHFEDLLFGRNGQLWCASGSSLGKGVYQFDGSSWTNYFAAQQDFPSDKSTSIVFDQQNRVWVGTWGGGVYRFNNGKFDVFNSQNNVLPGVPEDPDFVVVNKLVVDQIGTVWMTNFAAYNGNNLTAFTTDSTWVYFSQNDGILPANPQCIVVDQFNRKWVGTSSGIYVYDDNFTPADLTDDQIAGYLDMSDGLEGNDIKALAVDDLNTVWIGTTNGLNFFQDNRVFTKYGLITNDINCITVDPVGNKWIGTSSGASVLDNDDLNFTHYTVDTSPLVNSNVLSITFDRQTGTAYIGTSGGLSIFKTLYVEPKESLDQLFVYPNPFILSNNASGAVLVIDQLCRDCDVNIYSASGYLVRKLVNGSIGGRAVWDGRNDNNEPVASGIYLVVAAQIDGISISAKVAVIRQ